MILSIGIIAFPGGHMGLGQSDPFTQRVIVVAAEDYLIRLERPHISRLIQGEEKQQMPKESGPNLIDMLMGDLVAH